MSIGAGLLRDPPAGRSRSVRKSGFLTEWHQLTTRPRTLLRRGRLPFTFVSAATVLALWLLHFSAVGAHIVRAISEVSPSTPLYLAIARLPASMYAPAPNLPVEGSLLQVFVVFAMAEAWLGWRKTMTIALAVTFLCTLSGRIMCALGPSTIIGLPWVFQYVSDTGPSAAVVALVVYLCCVRHAPRTLAVVLTAMVTEVTLLPNLAGREHVVAIVVGLLTALTVRGVARHRGGGSSPAAVRQPGAGGVTSWVEPV
jgi:hypothetical protein